MRFISRLSLLAALFGAIAGAPSARAGQADGRLDIYWIDVEGGAATLVVTPAGESLLFDTGNPGRRDPERIFQTATGVAGLTKIDHLITTHYHGDHYGGAATLAQILPIGHVHDNGLFEGIRERPDQEYLDFKAERRSVLSPGDAIELEPRPEGNALRVRFRCLAARQQIAPLVEGEGQDNPHCAAATVKPIDISDNANSIVSLLTFGRFEFFDAGDLTWNVEHDLVCPTNRVGVVDVYQVSHHGLDSSNNPVLVQALQPTVAVMNNGVTKGCEPYTFATLKETPSIEAIYQLHRNRREDGHNNTADEFIANQEEACQAGYIKLSVDPTGETYTVSIPGTGHEATYRTK